MTFIGFVAFLDPAKKDAKAIIKEIEKYWNYNKNIDWR